MTLRHSNRLDFEGRNGVNPPLLTINPTLVENGDVGSYGALLLTGDEAL